MAFSGGVFSLYTPGNPVVTGTTITSAWANNTLSDIATGLSTCVLKDGTQTLTANIPMSGYKLTGLAAGSAAGDSVRWEQLPAVLISTASASGSSVIDFTGISSSYDVYVFELSNIVPSVDDSLITLRVSTDGGSTFLTSAVYTAQIALYAGAAWSDFTGGTQTSLWLSPHCGTNTGEATSGTLKFFAPSATTGYKQFTGFFSSWSASGAPQIAMQNGTYTGTQGAFNAVRFLMNTGNISSGRITMYGIKTS